MPIQARIITLNSQNPVALELLEHLSKEGIEAQLSPAVDGRAGYPELLNGETIGQQQSLLNRKSELTASEVGCYLSHYRLIKYAFDQQLSHICIFEDDVVAEPGLGEVIRRVCELDDQAHMVRLMSLKLRERKLVYSLTSQHQLVRPLRGALGTQGYVLNRQGMQRILSVGANICMPIDKLYDSFFLFDLHCYSVEPHVIYEIDDSSTVAKRYNELDKRLWVQLGWRLNKLNRSMRRKWHYLSHKSDFEPVSKPPTAIGKSKRLRH
jgi:glycosyl transferase family 25